jgi:DNA polymerase-3 subunit epsilon
MILFFDTETTGLPKNWKAPVTDLNNWPRMVQLAYILYDTNENVISKGDYIIKPEGYSIPSDSSNIHGISTEKAIREGKELRLVLDEFNSLLSKAEYLVAHNISFDEKIVGAEFLRIEMQNSIPSKRKICTMESSTNFCAIDGPYGYKWPKLSELHYKLFHSNFEEAHNAAEDIKATAKCFWELKRQGVINLSSPISTSAVVVANKKEFKNTKSNESEIIKKQIEDYCLQNDFKQIPLAAKAKAIMYLEFKCKQVSTNADVNDEFVFLKDYWAKNEENILNQTLNNYQRDFLLLIKKEEIEEHKSFSLFSDEKNKTIEDKISQFEVIAFINANDTKKYRDLVIHLYYYYLTRYREYLPTERKPTIFDENRKTDYSNYSTRAKTAHENFENLITNYSSVIEKTNNGGIPESIYTLVTNCSQELTTLKSEVGVHDKLYKDAASKIILLSSNLITDWTKACSNIMNIPIQGMRLGNTLFDICILTISEIDKIETDDNTKSWFNNIKVSFDRLKMQNTPKTGCYIATMAYGDYNHPQVIHLRIFRDKYLLTTRVGKILVGFYYWLSPKLVSMYKNNSFIKQNSRKLLDIIIKHIIPKDDR